LSGSERASSGVAGLDDILGGGFVPGRLHLLEGKAGTGKTTLGICPGRSRPGRKGALRQHVREPQRAAHRRGRPWLVLGGVELCELVPPDAAESDENRQTMFRPSEVELGETMRLLCAEIERIDPALIVLDSLSEMRLLAQNPLRYRRQISR
jgi:circadian clock protein KaiC